MATQKKPAAHSAANSRTASARQKRIAQANRHLLIGVLLMLLAVALIVVIIVLCVRGDGKKPADTSSPEASSAFAESSEAPSEPDESSAPELSEVEYSEDPFSRYTYEYQIDITPYLDYIEPRDVMEYVFLINPTHTLAADFVPADLVDCIHTRKDGRATQKLRLNAEMALEAFLKEGLTCGAVTNVTVTSAYRSYSYQAQLFETYCQQHQYKFKTREECEAYVLTFSTKPGTSEHQSGLCCDMHNLGSAEQSFAKKPEAKWLAENCWKFGFILRYPADKEDITKIIYEPWHFRFVGRFAATEMHELGMCLEEYIAYKGLE